MEIKKYGYGLLKLTPDTLFNLSLHEFADMVEALMAVAEDDFDLQMIRTAWSTALIMNSSGNYKRPIKPDRLYKSKYAKDTKEPAKMTASQQEAEKDKLKEIFKL